MGEFTCAKLPRYHISLEHAHLLLARSCMCYISICLKRTQRPTPADVSRCSGVSSEPRVALYPQLQPLLDYALDDALDHFGHLGSTFKTALGDIRILAEDIQRHSWIWDHVYTPARWEIHDKKPHWPMARHDLLHYILVAFASNSFMSTFFRRTPLKPKADTNPLVYAAYFNKEEHARILLSRGARLDRRGWETVGYCQSLPIEVAFRNRHYGMVIRLVEEGSTIPPHIFTNSFFKRAQFSNAPDISRMIPVSVARVLLQTDEFAENISDCLNEAGLRAMKMSNQLLIFRDATEQDLIAITRRFIQVTEEHLTPSLIRVAFLRFAVAKGYFHVTRYLLIILDTPLPSDLLVTLHHHSGRWKTALMIQLLVDNGADVLARTSDGDSLLHVILWGADNLRYMVDDADEDDILEAVKLVVHRGCDPLEADSRGKTPLHIAVKQGYISVARYLVALGASLPTDPVLPIVLQASHDEDRALETMKFLVGHGCNPLEADSRGNTPLRIAIERGYISVARYLFVLGALLPPDLLQTLNHDRLWWHRNAVALIHFLIENGVDVLEHNDERSSALHIVLRCFTDDESALEAVKVLVGRGCDPLEADSRGNTPLHIALGQGYMSVAQYLLDISAPFPPDLLVTLDHNSLHMCTATTIRFMVENGVDVLACTDDGDSVLHILLQSLYDGNQALEVVKLLVNYGCDPLVADSHGNTPLHIAVKRGHVFVARYLLTLAHDQSVTCYHQHPPHASHLLVERGANALAHITNGDSLLHTMLQSLSYHNEAEALEVVKLLVGYGWDLPVVNSHGKTPLHIAAEGGHVAVARYLLKLGAPVPRDLLVSLNQNQPCRYTAAMIHFLIENGVDVLARTDRGDSALHVVLRCFNDDGSALEAVKALVGHGCDPLEADSRGAAPLHIAVQQGHVSVARYLLTLGVSLPPDILVASTSPIHLQTTDILPLLIENGVDLLACTGNGDSVLHIMLQSIYDDAEALEAVKFLISHGCDPLEANLCGRTPLDIAVQQGHISVAKYLLTLGASVPPDILVASTPPTHILPFLVENGVNLLARTDGGDSVFHVMLQSIYDDAKALEAVKFLISHGCNPLEANLCGRTPLDIAVQRGHVSVARYLLTLGASVPPDILVASTSPIRFHTTDILPFLVENGVNLLAHNDGGDSVFHIMLQSIHSDAKALKAVKLLISYGCDPLEANSRGATPLHIAVQRGHISVARHLLTLGASVPPDILVASTSLIHFHTADTLSFLVENGVNLLARTDDGDSVFHVMLQSIYDDAKALEAVKFLISYGCDPLEANSRGATPLHIAVQQGHISVARYLLTLGASVPPDIFVASTSLIFFHTTDILPFLVENGVNLLARTDGGDSVFHITLQSIYSNDEALEAVKFLISHGCDPLGANLCGRTPLDIAVQRGHISVARYLLTLGASVPPDILVASTSPIHFHTTHTLPFLVENGVNLLARTDDGDSVFHVMLQSIYDDAKALEAVKFLVSYGCDPLRVEANSRGATLLHIAVQQGHVSVARYLHSLGAHLPSGLLVTWNCDEWNCSAEMIHFVFENGVDVLARTDDGDSAFHLILKCTYNDDKALTATKLLVNYGCDPLKANFHGTTPLHVAVARGHVSAVRYLFTLGAPVPPDLLVSSNGVWPRWGTMPMIRLLFENGVNVLAHASNGDSVLHTTLQCRNDGEQILEAVKLLVNYGCDPLEANSCGSTPLHIAVERGHISAARYLLNLGTPLPPDLLLTLDRNGSSWGTTPMIRFLFENGVDVHAHAGNGDSVLQATLQCQNDGDRVLEAVKLLVSYGCDPLAANSRGSTPLHIAVELGHISAARYLLTLGALVPPNLLVALDHEWSWWSTAPMIRFLFENGVDFLARTSNGDSVLHTAFQCFNGDEDVLITAKLLVGYGYDPLDANSRGEIPLHFAARRSYVSVARYLIQQGANVLTKASNGDTVLHFATGAAYPNFDDHKYVDGHILKAVQFFVACDCEPAAPNNNGKTPLHNVVGLGRLKTMKYLLSLNIQLPTDILFTAIKSDNNSTCRRHIVETLVTAGCDTQTRNSEGVTPLQTAIIKGRVDVVEYLLSVVSVHDLPFEDLLSAVDLAPQSVQSETRRLLSNRRTRSESPSLPPAKRAKHS